MSQQTLEGRMNAEKENFLNLLKVEGKYVKYCPMQGYIYQYTGSLAKVFKGFGDLFGKVVNLAVALKNGKLYVLKLETII